MLDDAVEKVDEEILVCPLFRLSFFTSCLLLEINIYLDYSQITHHDGRLFQVGSHGLQ
jgi:hypothetical protein